MQEKIYGLSKKTSEDKIAEIQEKYKDKTLESADTYQKQLDEKNKQLDELTSKIYVLPNGAEKGELMAQKSALQKEVDELTELNTQRKLLV